MLATELEKRTNVLAEWMLMATHMVVFTGAGISTESGLADFRGPEGLWTRQAKDDRAALGLSYARLGGRPARRTVWFVTLRKHIVTGLRPMAMPAMKDHGCFAIVFD